MHISRFKRLALLATPVVVPVTTFLIYRATYNGEGVETPAPWCSWAHY